MFNLLFAFRGLMFTKNIKHRELLTQSNNNLSIIQDIFKAIAYIICIHQKNTHSEIDQALLFKL